MPQNLEDYLYKLPDYLWNLLLMVAAFLSGLLIKGLFNLVIRFSNKTTAAFSFIPSVTRRLSAPLTLFLPLFLFNIFIPELRLRLKLLQNVDKTVEVLLIIAFAYLLIGFIKIFTDYFIDKYNINKVDNLVERKVRTQLQFIRKVLVAFIIVCACCAVLLSFDNMRKLGAGLLTGVGVGGIIIGFAAQKSLANLLAGFQIAFTQPIRIDDVLVVEGEWGRVEEITLTYVVLNIWDKRRMIFPINYFIEKPFQNWTRNNSELLGTVLLYVDYTIPIEALRAAFLKLVKGHPLWDEQVAVVQVTNATEKSVEIRLLVSSFDSGKAFDLRCFLREKMIEFIQTNYPNSFPKTRLQIENENTENTGLLA